jgi:hypothetical protein
MVTPTNEDLEAKFRKAGPGIFAGTEKVAPDILKKESYTPDGELMDEAYYRRQKQLAEQKERDRKYGAYDELRRKLDLFKSGWARKSLAEITTTNQAADSFLDAFYTAPTEARKMLVKNEIHTTARMLKAYKSEFEAIVGFIDELEKISTEEEQEQQ